MVPRHAYIGTCFIELRVAGYYPVMKNQIEKKVQHDVEAGFISLSSWGLWFTVWRCFGF